MKTEPKSTDVAKCETVTTLQDTHSELLCCLEVVCRQISVGAYGVKVILSEVTKLQILPPCNY